MSTIKQTMKKNRYLIYGILSGVILIGAAYALSLPKTPDSSIPATPSPTVIEPSVAEISSPPISSPIFSQRLLYWEKNDNTNNIYAYDGEKKHLLFTDSNEKQKILSFSNFSQGQTSLLALTSTNKNDTLANLYLISLDGKGQMTEIAKDFSTNEPPLPVISPDNQKIAYVNFSNAEADYGYSLYTMNIDGTNKRKITTEAQEISLLLWHQNSQSIIYLNNNNVIKQVQLNNQKTTTLYKYPDNTSIIISNFIWGAENELILSHGLKSNPAYSLGQLNINTKSFINKSYPEIPTDNYILSPNKQDLIYLSANHTLTSYNLLSKKNQDINLTQVEQIIGWLP